MSQRSRVLGVDYGTVRIGLAVSDPERRIASPLTTYFRRDMTRDASFFKQLIDAEEIGQIVVGLPVHMSGDDGEKAAEARSYGSWLRELTQLPIAFWDERFTTVEAERHLQAARLSRQQRRDRRDRVAAQIMLQSFLDAGCPANEPPRALDS